MTEQPGAILRALQLLSASFDGGMPYAPNHAVLGISPDAAREASVDASAELAELTARLDQARKDRAQNAKDWADQRRRTDAAEARANAQAVEIDQLNERLRELRDALARANESGEAMFADLHETRRELDEWRSDG